MIAIASLLALAGCSAAPEPMTPVDYVDLKRFMGDWYVIANIPTWVEKDAYNAIETYRLADDGTIDTRFTFRKGGFDGEPKEYSPRGFVVDTESNALWGMQFVWPFKGDYRVIYLDEDYSTTVIGRIKRDYVWLMARDPDISQADLDAAMAAIERAGYDMSLVQRVPQEW